jgi:cyanophycin synthetase
MKQQLAYPSRVNFDDTVLHYLACRARGRELSSFLLALAAFQRGLAVTFHRTSLGKTSQLQGNMANGLYGSVFSISDGTRTHYFNRSMGDKTSLEASALAEDKNLTKLALARCGIRTPEGVVVKAGDVKCADKFLSSHASQRFVVKPLRGSMSTDTYVDITAAEAQERIASARSGEWLIEEFISGHELRADVVGEKCVSVFLRACPSVVGNGVDTIATLVDKKNKLRERNVAFGIYPFIFEADDLRYLQAHGRNIEDVPHLHEIVKISCKKRIHAGADCQNVVENVNENFHLIAVSVCKALGLPNAGLDIIISDDPSRPGSFVLEANQRSVISGSCFPTLSEGDGNAVSEAILDLYFPASQNNRRFYAAGFDFPDVIQALQSCQIGEVRLPVLTPDWHHCRLAFSDEATRVEVVNILISAGAYLRLLNLSSGKTLADVLLSPESLATLMASRQHIAGLSPQSEALLFGSGGRPAHGDS